MTENRRFSMRRKKVSHAALRKLRALVEERPRAHQPRPIIDNPQASTHYLERTSEKVGTEPWRGRCVLCGAEGLPIEAASQPCPNPKKLTHAAAMAACVLGSGMLSSGKA